jgi:hypothetical protein
MKTDSVRGSSTEPIEAWFYEGNDPLIPRHGSPHLKFNIVVASYNEQLRWCPLWESFNEMMNLIPNCETIVYRTGARNDETLKLKNKVTYLPNKGREAGQWLAHIVNNYDNLADITLFVQADLGVNSGVGNQWPIDLNLFKMFRLPMKDIREEGMIDDFSAYTWPAFNRIRASCQTQGMQEKYNYGIGPGQDIKSGQWYETAKLLYGATCPNKINMPSGGHFLGAQFMATRNLIQRKSKAYYTMCMNNAKQYELAHALEFGGWPALVMDIYGNHADKCS